MLLDALREECGIEDATTDDIKVEVTGVNHFTWLTKATYKNIDIFPVYRKFCEKYKETGHGREKESENWMNRYFKCNQRVKIDLFLRYGYIAAAGDRHLAEFCPANWYMQSPEMVESWGFSLTPVQWRKDRTKELIQKSKDLAEGKRKFEIAPTSEKGVEQMKALLGLGDLITNVNIPNYGQIPNLPLGAVVETNAYFTADTVTPMYAGPMPSSILGLTEKIVVNQMLTVDAVMKKDLDIAFEAFINDPQNHLDMETSRKLFDEMVENTKAYLTMY